MKRLMFVVGAFAVGSAFAAGQDWNGGSAGNDLSTAANWSRNLSVIYDPTKTYSGGEIPGEADLNLWVRKDVPEASKITLAQDITSGRLGSDAANKEIYLDFSGHTLTLNGICGVAFHQNGDNGKIHYLGGKVVIPYNSSWPYNCCLALSYNNNTKHDLRFFIGDGTGTAEIDTYGLRLAYGTNNAVVVKNNGILKCRGDQIVMGQADKTNPSIGLDNGIVLDGGTFVNTASDRKLAIAGGGSSKNAYFEIRPGSALQNVDYVTLSGTGSSFVLNGAGVSFTQAMNNRWEIYSEGCVVVSNGASFLMDSGEGKTEGWDRVWLNGGAKVVADGVGTTFRINGSKNATSLLGQSSNDNRIEVKNGARMILDPANNSGNVNIGQGSSTSYETCQGNAVVVDGGVLVAGTFKVGAAPGSSFTQSNRYEIVNGGIATNRNIIIAGEGSGDSASDRYNVCLVSNKSSLVANYLIVGYHGYGNRFSVADHSAVTLNNDLLVGHDWTYAGTNEAVEVSGGSVVSVKGAVHDFGYNTEWVVDDGKITATELHFHRQGNPSGSTPGSRMIVAGKNPVLMATREADADLLVFRTTSHVTFQLPEGGYAEAPLQAPGGRVSAWDMTFDFDLSKLPTKLEEEYSTTLATAKALNINAGAQNSMKNNFASAIQAKYGDTVSKAEITFSKTDVTLTIKPKKGMLLIFR